jgi:citronellol/citronellal dehydrogenase
MTKPLFAPGLFEGQTAIVTGGGTGIGLAGARELGSLGAKIAICGRRQEPLDASAAKLEGEGITVFRATCDIRDPESIAKFAAGVKEAFGTVDVLINNAGGQFPSPATNISPRGFEAVVRNNLLGTFNFTHAIATTFFIPQKRGRIVNVIAQMIRGFPGMSHTGAARAGVDNLTKTLAVEWSQFGIRVNAVAPGLIQSSGSAQYPPSVIEAMSRATPVKRAGTSEEVSHLVVYLASTYADFVTGQTYYIDGGQSLWGDIWPIPDDIPRFPPHPIEET